MNYTKHLLTVLILLSSGLISHAQQKVLIAYFSHSGNTKTIAKYIQELSGADIFEIKTVVEYPTEYQVVVDQAKKEIKNNYKPELKTLVENFDDYDTIFIGSPNWWSTIAPPVATFLSSYNFKDKTVVQFMTHGGGKFGRSTADIKRLCPDSNMLKGFECRGSNVANVKDDVKNWLSEIGFIK